MQSKSLRIQWLQTAPATPVLSAAFVSEDLGVTAGQGCLGVPAEAQSSAEPQPSVEGAALEEVCQTAGDLVWAVTRGDQFLSRGSLPGSF